MMTSQLSTIAAIEPSDTGEVACPQCGGPAVAQWRRRVGSTSGSVEHVMVRRLDRHWFLLPASAIDPAD